MKQSVCNKFRLILSLFIIVLFLNLVYAADLDSQGNCPSDFDNCVNANFKEGIPPTLISGDVEVTEKIKDLNIEGGTAKLHLKYTGTISFNGEGKIISANGLEHIIKKGVINVKNGEIFSVEKADVEKLEIPSSEYVIYGIKGKNIDYDSVINKLTSDYELTIDDGGEVRTIVPENGKTFSINFKEDSFGSKALIFDSEGNFVMVSDNEGNVGRLNGEFWFGRKDFYLVPSEGKDFAEFKLSNGLNGKITENTLFNYFEKIAYDHLDECLGIVSCISISSEGELHISALKDNKISLESEDNYEYIGVDRIDDDSSVSFLLTDGKNSNLALFFSKGKPLVQGNLAISNSLIGTQFIDDGGKVWSWEITDGTSKPDIYQRNILFLSSEKEILYKYDGGFGQTFVDPRTGKSIKKEPSMQTFAKRMLSLSLEEGTNLAYSETYLEGEKPHSYNVESRTFNDPASFFDALDQEGPNGEKFDRLMIHSHGSPELFWAEESITRETLEGVSPSKLQSIREGFSSSATCTAISCLIFLNSETDLNKPKYEPNEIFLRENRYTFGSELSKFLNIPVIGSVPQATIQLSNGEYKSISSEKWVTGYPSGEVKKEAPSGIVRILLVLING